MQFQKVILGLSFLSLGLIGCGINKKTKTGQSGVARAAFANETASLHLGATYFTPTYFGVKIKFISISTDEDTTVGSGSVIWLNPDCPKEELEDSVTDGDVVTNYTYVGAGNCPTADVDTYIDLAQSSKKVNAELNSENLPVLPFKTFNYAHIELCNGDADTDPGNNLKFKDSGMESAQAIRTGACGFSSAKFSEPLEVTESTSVTVTLQYDLSEVIYDYGEGMTEYDYCYFNDDETMRRCAQVPELTATVTAD